jgi:hypothetical protein
MHSLQRFNEVVNSEARLLLLLLLLAAAVVVVVVVVVGCFYNISVVYFLEKIFKFVIHNLNFAPLP